MCASGSRHLHAVNQFLYMLDPNPGRTSKRKQRLYRVRTVTDVAAYAGSERGTIRRLALKVKTKSSV